LKLKEGVEGSFCSSVLLLRFARPAPVMSPSHSCSSCTWGMKNSTVSSHGGVGRRFDFAPLCHCGEKAIMRTARTAKNRGRKFWGCPKFKVWDMEMNLVVFFGGFCFSILVLENLILQFGFFVSFDRVEVKKLLAATFFHGAVKM